MFILHNAQWNNVPSHVIHDKSSFAQIEAQVGNNTDGPRHHDDVININATEQQVSINSHWAQLFHKKQDCAILV